MTKSWERKERVIERENERLRERERKREREREKERKAWSKLKLSLFVRSRHYIPNQSLFSTKLSKIE